MLLCFVVCMALLDSSFFLHLSLTCISVSVIMTKKSGTSISPLGRFLSSSASSGRTCDSEKTKCAHYKHIHMPYIHVYTCTNLINVTLYLRVYTTFSPFLEYCFHSFHYVYIHNILLEDTKFLYYQIVNISIYPCILVTH